MGWPILVLFIGTGSLQFGAERVTREFLFVFVKAQIPPVTSGSRPPLSLSMASGRGGLPAHGDAQGVRAALRNREVFRIRRAFMPKQPPVRVMVTLHMIRHPPEHAA